MMGVESDTVVDSPDALIGLRPGTSKPLAALAGREPHQVASMGEASSRMSHDRHDDRK